MAGKSSLNKGQSVARENQTESSGMFFKVKKVLYRGKSGYQNIEIIVNRDYGRILFLDGLVQTTERDEFYYHEMLVHPALASHGAPKSVLIIGGGDGGALNEVLRHPVKKVRLVEIDGQVLKACREHFPWLKSAFEDSRAELVVADGNDFIRETKETYDVILIDSSDPVGPSAILHRKTFYQGLKKRLRPGGIIAAQAGSLMLHQEEHREKYLFLKKLFHYAFFYVGPVPTYPVGTWCYNFLSDSKNPLAAGRLTIPSGLKYYTRDIHKAAFALPAFLKAKLGLTS